MSLLNTASNLFINGNSVTLAYLNGNQIFSSSIAEVGGVSIVTDSLFMHLDASDYTTGTWNDRTANANNATINGATWSSTDGGIFDLDGTNDTISIPHKSSLSLITGGQRTIQVWVKFDTLPSLNTEGQPVFGKLSSNFNFDGYYGTLFSNTANTRVITNGTGTAGDVNATGPFTWATSDRFIWNGSYEIA